MCVDTVDTIYLNESEDCSVYYHYVNAYTNVQWCLEWRYDLLLTPPII